MTLANPLTRTATAVALGLSTALAPVALPAALAQESGAEAPAGEYTDEMLGKFVDAAMAVSAVRNEYAPQLQQAENEQAAQSLAEEAVTEMQAAVEAVDGIDVDTYTAIGEAAQNDEALAARITEIVQERQGGAPGDG